MMSSIDFGFSEFGVCGGINIVKVVSYNVVWDNC